MEPTLNSYLVLSAVLFAIGTAGVFLRRNLITILLSIEVMLNAVNLTFVAVDRFRGLIDGQIVQTGGPELALHLEEEGYDWLREKQAEER